MNLFLWNMWWLNFEICKELWLIEQLLHFDCLRSYLLAKFSHSWKFYVQPAFFGCPGWIGRFLSVFQFVKSFTKFDSYISKLVKDYEKSEESKACFILTDSKAKIMPPLNQNYTKVFNVKFIEDCVAKNKLLNIIGMSIS